jgi:LPXTG-motif cell wall-anchored protein
LSIGDTWNLFDASLASSGAFDNNAVFGTAGDGTFLPVLGSGLAWNFNYGSGELSVIAAIPEPSTFVLGGLALLGFAGVGLRRRRKIS